VSEEWYAPYEFNYWQKQVYWALGHYSMMMEQGKWPPQKTGYTYAPKTQQLPIRAKAPFLTSVEVIAEINRRLKECGHDGKMAMSYYEDSDSVEKIAGLAQLSVYDVAYHIARAIRYVSSGMTPRWITTYKKDGTIKRKGKTYEDWCNWGGIRILKKHDFRRAPVLFI
jgi:hypothetical protein